MIKKLLWAVMRWAGLDAPWVLWRSSVVTEDGWFRSYRERASVDANGGPVPWISYPAIDLLRRRVLPDLTVFEFGSGGSTLWWAARVASVHVVEHDKDWFQSVSARVPTNVEIEWVPLEPGGEYCRRAKAQPRRFDVVVVDGRDRVNCAINSVDALSERGVILWDDSDRPRYAEGAAELIARGFRRLELVGLGPIEPSRKETSIFYRPGNWLGL